MSFIWFKYLLFLIACHNSILSQSSFRYGVASGDPKPNAIILWTKITPNTTDSIIYGSYQLSTNRSFKENTKQIPFATNSSKNYCVKVDASNLTPNTWYYYRFIYKNDTSIIGRTKTAPNTNQKQVNFAVVSCSNYEHGYFNVYESITKANNVEAIIHLGDYIYEMPTGVYSANMLDRKTFPPYEILTLTDYRDRYAHYRKDQQLQQLHQNFPFINIWDDHEIANDSYKNGASNHDSTEGDYLERLKHAKQAYYEWMPIREKEHSHLYRKLTYGDNINLLFLDTRIDGRDKQSSRKKRYRTDSTRRLIGDKQFNWIKNNVSRDSNTWNIFAQQVMITPFKVAGVTANPDQWDGYLYEKNRLIDYLVNQQIKNIVVLTGDLHSAWVNDIPLKKYKARNGKNSLGVEFITPSITSSRGIPIPAWSVKLFNKHVKYLELKKHGYINFSISPEEIQANFNYVSTILSKDWTLINGPSFYMSKGTSNIERMKENIYIKTTNPPLVNY